MRHTDSSEYPEVWLLTKARLLFGQLNSLYTYLWIVEPFVLQNDVTVGHSGNVVANHSKKTVVGFGDTCLYVEWELQRLVDVGPEEFLNQSLSLDGHPNDPVVSIEIRK